VPTKLVLPTRIEKCELHPKKYGEYRLEKFRYNPSIIEVLEFETPIVLLYHLCRCIETFNYNIRGEAAQTLYCCRPEKTAVMISGEAGMNFVSFFNCA